MSSDRKKQDPPSSPKSSYYIDYDYYGINHWAYHDPHKTWLLLCHVILSEVRDGKIPQEQWIAMINEIKGIIQEVRNRYNLYTK
jgi:hypothetical protein